MTVKELKEAGAIYAGTLGEALSSYSHRTVLMDGKTAADFFLEQKKAGGKVYLDFYYYVLEEKAAEKVRSVLSEEEIQYLRELDHREGEVIFPAEDRLIRIAASLNESEMLFSTFYVVEKDGAASIWWGNYRGEYEKFFPAETGRGSGPVPAECTENP